MTEKPGAGTDTYLRHPHLHGDLITFVADDDVWLAPLDGGRAWRVTADQVSVSHPRFSPDGTHLAWTSTRDGAPEVYVAPVEGGPARRLTHWGSRTTVVRGWTPDGRVLALSAAGEASARRVWARAVPLDGAPAERLPYGPVGAVAWQSPKAAGEGPAAVALLSAGMNREAAWWKRYRGGTAGKLWIGEPAGPLAPTEFRRLLPELDGRANIESPVWIGGRLVFLSDHDGIGNVYSVLPDGTDLRRHSDHTEFYARGASGDGARVVYHSAGELWLLEPAGDGAPGGFAEPRRLAVRLGGPRTGREPFPVDVRRHLGDAVPDRTGRGALVEVRGTVHWTAAWFGPARALSVQPGVRARLPRLLGDTGLAAWVDDAEGEDAVVIAPTGDAADGTTAAGAGAQAPGNGTEDTGDGRQRAGGPRRLAAGRLGRVLEMVASPDGERIALATHDGRVLLLRVSSGELTELARSEHGDADGLTFSPDSRWLAWSSPGPEPLRQLRLADLAKADEGDVAGAVFDATPLRFADFSPAFTRDGKHLAFLSVRSFDPVYDAHVFDLSFPAGCRPFLLPLAAETPSPFDPLLRGRGFGGDDDPSGDDTEDDSDTGDGDKKTEDASGTGDGAADDAENGSGSNAGGAKDGAKAGAKNGGRNADRAPRTSVDREGLAERVVPFPVPAGNLAALRAAKGAVLWLREPVAGVLGDNLATPDDDAPETVLERFDLGSLRTEELLDSVDSYEVTGDGTRLLVQDGHRLRLVPADRKPSPDSPEDDVRPDLDRIRFDVDPVAEWRQAYDEAWRLMRDHFWHPGMVGPDWEAVRRRYLPVLARVGTRDEFVDVLWEVQGELNTSHAYVMPPGNGRDPARAVGLLGADLRADGDGRWRVERVLPGESSDPRARSPLAAPGVAVRAGDELVAVDGRPVDPLTGPAPLLAGKAGKPVELTVRPAAGGALRRVVVVPLDSEESLRYQDWVADRRRYVHERSGGRLGYLHVPDMVGAGWAQLHRDLRVEVVREGLVVDVRENRGGHTSQLVVEKLARRIVGWDVPRGMQPVSYPQDAPRGPVVAVADEFSGSDGDIVTAAIKALGIGPVVGTRTWGGVVGIDSRYHLVDGTLVTQPRYAFWLDGYGWEVENHGVDPDVEVVCAPQDWAAGRDPQLDEAVRIALERLAATPARTAPPRP
ncbi:S41 family peptidase [Allostreptomyces psammosilenae]|uniref:Tricorn protease homolog n=1 Tax=Allostreptomyces psammosilenae TaxID=1892865 RepID=A0A852ZW99_9ACTN|nr:S41 family peptidase [Allostreptomyces psammosilenae]NYI06673.1 tricorn protease [Allostreptomyces psammosilenae]